MSDEATFNEFVTTRGPALQRAAYLLTGDHHTAEDLVQTALLQAAQRWEQIHTSPEAYVRRSIFTANVSRWRRIKFREHSLTAVDAQTSGPLTSHHLESSSASRLTMEQALATLTSKQRAVLVLRYYVDLTESETARTLGVSVGTVKSTHARALDRLRATTPELSELIGRTL